MVSNFEHPVLMKLLAGSFLPREKPAMEIEETRAGRAPMPFIFAGLALVTGLLARALAGNAAGLTAAALVAIEPTLRGHGPLVQSDVLVTFFLVASALALEYTARQHGRLWLLASGVLYGFAMASKYSAFPFLVVFAVVAMLRFPEGSISSRVKRGSVLFVVALVTLFLVQFGAFAGTSDTVFRAAISREFAGLPQERAALSLAETYPKGIAAYGAGLLFVQGVAGPGERFNYFFGEVSGRGRPLYFPVALGIKLTLATVLLVLGALAASVTLLARGSRARRLLAARACLPAALGGAYLLATCASNVNIGVRHALPVVPFAIVAATAALRPLVRRRRTLAIAFAAVVLAAAAEAGLRFGREISFGNLLVGGPAGVPALLSDSNVDWGQEQGRVFERVRRGDLGRVGLTSLVVDESGARAVGIAGQAMTPDAPVDTVFFSRFLWDTAAAIEKNTESWPKFVWLRSWLPPLRHGLEARAVSVEPFGDAQFLMRLRAVAPATAAPSAAPAPTR
jgi:4-amino-4-deoxy-L-arabinose transferase-like glycosyltransferase